MSYRIVRSFQGAYDVVETPEPEVLDPDDEPATGMWRCFHCEAYNDWKHPAPCWRCSR